MFPGFIASSSAVFRRFWSATRSGWQATSAAAIFARWTPSGSVLMPIAISWTSLSRPDSTCAFAPSALMASSSSSRTNCACAWTSNASCLSAPIVGCVGSGCGFFGIRGPRGGLGVGTATSTGAGGAASGGDGTASTGDGTASAGDGTASTDDGTASTGDGTASTGDGTASTDDGTASTGDGTASTDDGTASTGDGTASTDDGT